MHFIFYRRAIDYAFFMFARKCTYFYVFHVLCELYFVIIY